MAHQTDQELDRINNGVFIEALTSSPGWQLLDRRLQMELSALTERMRHSDVPDIVMSCVKKKDGIMLIYESIEDIKKEGIPFLE